MFSNSKVNSILSLVVLSVGIGIYHFVFDTDAPIKKELPAAQHNDEKQSNKVQPVVEDRDPDGGSIASIAVPKLKEYDEEWCFAAGLTQDAKDLADSEYQDWADSRNHVVGDRASQVENYKGYSDKVLKELGDQGDLIALAAIVDSDRSTDDMKVWAAKKAAVYGGTGDAVSYFSIQNKGLFKALLYSGKTEEAKQALLESIAWDEFLALRGDISLLENLAFILSFEKMKDIEISEDDEKWISSRAREIYSELSEERISLGLAPFDNTVPKVVEVENAQVVAFALKQYDVSNKWVSKYYPSSRCVERSLRNAKNK